MVTVIAGITGIAPGRGSPSGGLTWAATGHRPDKLGGYDDKTYARLVYLACRFLIEFKPSRMISGMALGWDIAMAEACIRCNVPFVAAVPFEGQEKYWPESAQGHYRTLLQWAQHVEIVCTIAPEHIDRTWWISDVMMTRNAWMVDRCEAVVALYDGSNRGGTFNCVEYAKRFGKPIVNLWDQFRK